MYKKIYWVHFFPNLTVWVVQFVTVTKIIITKIFNIFFINKKCNTKMIVVCSKTDLFQAAEDKKSCKNLR